MTVLTDRSTEDDGTVHANIDFVKEVDHAEDLILKLR